jgi:hypothetical protein
MIASCRPRYRRRGQRSARLALALFAASFPGAGSAQEGSDLEYRVKAAFLYNFSKFVDWPVGVFDGTQAPLVIGILGEDPFGPILDQTVAGKTIGSRPFAIQRGLQLDELQNVHVLFISRSETQRLAELFGALQGRNVLTVSEIEEFAQRGGIISFLMEQSKVRFQINPAAADGAGLRISSKLLRLAQVVSTERPPTPLDRNPEAPLTGRRPE